MDADDPPLLTDRERETLRLVAQGYTNKEIARRLRLSAQTIHNRLWLICGVLRARNRTEAVVEAWRLGLIDLPYPVRMRREE